MSKDSSPTASKLQFQFFPSSLRVPASLRETILPGTILRGFSRSGAEAQSFYLAATAKQIRNHTVTDAKQRLGQPKHETTRTQGMGEKLEA